MVDWRRACPGVSKQDAYMNRGFCMRGRVCDKEDCNHILWPSYRAEAEENNIPVHTFGETWLPRCFVPLRDKKGRFTKRW